MTPITRQDILAHQSVVPWAAQYQVEQDLLLCRSMAALFADDFLRGQIAMRGALCSTRCILRRPRATARTLIWLPSEIVRKITSGWPSAGS